MMTEHTPGLWRKHPYSVDGNKYAAIRTTNGIYDIATIHIIDTESGNANANLIAASPDLLAACEAALVELEEFGNYTADALGVMDLAGRRPRRRIETQLIRAIRKAKGESDE